LQPLLIPEVVQTPIPSPMNSMFENLCQNTKYLRLSQF
jgi:hypothetical protein